MLLVPLYRKPDWKSPPLVTLLLILVNVLVFATVQRSGDRVIGQAVDFYFSSSLPQIELPAYAEDLADRGKSVEADTVRQLISDEGGFPDALWMMEADEPFMARLRAGEVIRPGEARHAAWTEARARFDAMMRSATTFAYGFVPAEHRPVSFLTHMFLHGDVMHLAGNMVFLFAVGFAVEAVLGGAAYLGAYLLAGLVAVALFWVVYPLSGVPLVGASGAISGLMGLYTALFWTRRIRFFYFVFVYFNFMRAPAIILLPLWLANEFYQLHFGGDAMVAYVAHIGGLLGGALTGLAARRLLAGINTGYMELNEREERHTAGMAEGLQLMAAMKFDHARRAFEAVLAENPDDREALLQLYTIARFRPESEDYHRIAARVLSLPGKDPQTLRLLSEKLNDYAKTARPSVRLAPAQCLALARRLLGGGYLDDAERLVGAVARADPGNRELPGELLALATAFTRNRDERRAERYVQTLAARYPGSPEAAHAARLRELARQAPPRPPAGPSA